MAPAQPARRANSHTGPGLPRNVAREPLPIYIMPSRIQQGWGDVAEIARASAVLHRAGFPLYSLEPPREGDAAPPRKDPRVELRSPRDERWLGFPPVRRLARPIGKGRAAILITWWGMAGRRSDREGSPVPGPYAPAVESIVAAHPPGAVLILSLEEFAFSAGSRESSRESFRQAGWTEARGERHLRTPEGRRRIGRYHRAFVTARGGDAPEVLHLVGTFAANPAGVREFPFLVEVGPYAISRRRPVPPRSSPRREVLWYASASGSESLLAPLLRALGEQEGAPWTLSVRTNEVTRQPLLSRGNSIASSSVRLEWLPPLPGASWERRLRSARLLIVGGGQSLVDAVASGRPLLYFNGTLGGEGSSPVRAYRREKLLTLTRAMRARGAPPGLVRDLLDFADGRNVRPILARALGMPAWSKGWDAFYQSAPWPPVDLPAPRADGGRYLVDVCREFARGRLSARDLVASRRAGAV